MELIRAVYQATSPERNPETLAENIAREQSLELTRALIPEAIAERLLGRVLDVTPLAENRWALEIGYPVELASGQAGQLLHLLYGNVSFYPRIRLTGLKLPESLLARFPGPIGGLPDIRCWTGVPDRALLMTVLKPRGSAPSVLADLALAFARGGGDLIKDDQNLVEDELPAFRQRVGACAAAVEKAAEETGRRCLYLPHVAGSGSHLERQLDFVRDSGLGGVVLCTWVMGLETAAAAARERELMWLSHPAMAGAFTEPEATGIASAVLLGTLLRVAGADISIFPGRGGRIRSGHADDETATCRALAGPLGSLKATLPCTGGGKTLEQAVATARAQGPDCAILVGGDLIARHDRIQADVAATVAALQAC
ncbi:RuBisCO large subunit C-terminal-like domain-containing protein [Wenzhouxiangella limi]|uniref:Ribulose 1,5-bisphosphate carboxylase n=1 Tax=Wenzhouxiangella limi TaxID=2707351 RepID=A0A845V3C3_9GAMM|nr:RuBisCO large subunit C-terminal-like domain-containing protein [Wenzhouxiangella limi]NDY94495.1 ribulose 1,5-bisphosphate carboxylase [Wenzhouxiangella limi]